MYVPPSTSPEVTLEAIQRMLSGTIREAHEPLERRLNDVQSTLAEQQAQIETLQAASEHAASLRSQRLSNRSAVEGPASAGPEGGRHSPSISYTTRGDSVNAERRVPRHHTTLLAEDESRIQDAVDEQNVTRLVTTSTPNVYFDERRPDEVEEELVIPRRNRPVDRQVEYADPKDEPRPFRYHDAGRASLHPGAFAPEIASVLASANDGISFRPGQATTYRPAFNPRVGRVSTNQASSAIPAEEQRRLAEEERRRRYDEYVVDQRVHEAQEQAALGQAQYAAAAEAVRQLRLASGSGSRRIPPPNPTAGINVYPAAVQQPAPNPPAPFGAPPVPFQPVIPPIAPIVQPVAPIAPVYQPPQVNNPPAAPMQAPIPAPNMVNPAPYAAGNLAPGAANPGGAMAPQAFAGIFGARRGVDDLLADAEYDCQLNSMVPVRTWVDESKLVQGLRPSRPESYSGEDRNVRTLETFIHGVVSYLRVTRMLRTELIPDMVQFIGTCLTGPAHEWFKNHVAVSPYINQWTPRAVFIGLRERFIQESDLSESAREFDRWRQGSNDVSQAYHDLMAIVDRMIQLPSDYEIARRFFFGLRSSLRDAMAPFGDVPEKRTVLELRDSAVRQEEAQNYGHRHDSHRTQSASKAITSTSSSQKPTQSGSYKRTTTTTRESRSNEAATSSRYPARDSTLPKDSGTKPNPTSSKPPTFKPRGSRNPTSAIDMSAVTCFKCNKKGHYANKCPNAPSATYMLQMGMSEHINEAQARMAVIDDRDYSSDEDEEREPEDSGGPEGQSDHEGDRRGEGRSADESSGTDDGYRYFGPRYESSGNDDDADYDNPQTRSIRVCRPRRARIVAGRRQCGRHRCCCRSVTSVSESSDSSDDEPKPATSMLRIIRNGELRIHAASAAEPDPKDLLFIGNLSRRNLGQPVRDRKSQRCVEAYVQIEGHVAHALLDSGSNVDIISADFASATELKTFELKDPLNLQMACVGSKAKLQYGAFLDLKGPLINERRYFDVANVEGFDMILGTPFLYANGITLHFNDAGKAYARVRGKPKLSTESPVNPELQAAAAQTAPATTTESSQPDA